MVILGNFMLRQSFLLETQNLGYICEFINILEALLPHLFIILGSLWCTGAWSAINLQSWVALLEYVSLFCHPLSWKFSKRVLCLLRRETYYIIWEPNWHSFELFIWVFVYSWFLHNSLLVSFWQEGDEMWNTKRECQLVHVFRGYTQTQCTGNSNIGQLPKVLIEAGALEE